MGNSTMSINEQASQALAQPLTLTAGLTIANRICKSALSEQLSDRNHNPTDELIHLYRRWSKGGAGLLVTGNVMLAADMIGEPKNIVLNEFSDLNLFKRWAQAAKSGGAKCFMQLNHPGRQVPNFLALTPKAPSAIAMSGAMRMGFNKPKALTGSEIEQIIECFATSAKLAKECGFDGVQIHGAHGYLVNQFLSPLQNQRSDQWGGELNNRMRFVLAVYQAIRQAVGKDFPVAIKLNCTDAQAGGYCEEDALQVAQALDNAGIDMIEISGGNYETQAMVGSAQSVKAGSGYFADFAKRLKSAVSAPVMVTGGMRNPGRMKQAILAQDYDFVGMGRPLALDPDLPNKILRQQQTELIETPYIKTRVAWLDKLLLINITWYEQQLKLLAMGKDSQPKLSPWRSMLNTSLALGYKALLPRRS